MGEIIAWLAMSVIFQGVSAYSKIGSSNAKLKQLEIEGKQSSLKRIEESISNYDILEQTLKTQLAESTTRGTAMGSPSFEALQLDTINTIFKKEKNLDLEESLFQKGLKIEKASVKRNLYTSLFGDVTSIGFNAASTYAGAGKSSGSSSSGSK